MNKIGFISLANTMAKQFSRHLQETVFFKDDLTFKAQKMSYACMASLKRNLIFIHLKIHSKT
jgi:hypothetical protein